MKEREEIVNGKRRIILTRKASGVDKVREAALVILGPGYELKKKEEKDVNKK